MASIKSLHLFAEAALQNEPPAYYHIHIIANDIVSAVNLPHRCLGVQVELPDTLLEIPWMPELYAQNCSC